MTLSPPKMVYFFGLIFGVFGAGLLSDKFGRKATLGPIGIALGTVGLITAAMPSVEAFVAVREGHNHQGQLMNGG